MIPEDRALLEQHIKGIEVLIAGGPYQFSQVPHDESRWIDGAANDEMNTISGGWFLRPKPQPRVLPWTMETCPVGKEVIHKSTRNRYQIIAATDCEALIWTERVAYTYLLAYYVMADDSPCGTVEAGA